MTLGAEEYGSFVKLAACEKREKKFTLLRKIFSGLETLHYEKQGEFQYYFKTEVEKRGHTLVDENRDGNMACILLEGSCGIYKSGKNGLENLEKWKRAAPREVRYHPDFEDICGRLERIARYMPSSSSLFIGEVSHDEAVGLEAFVNDSGRGLFTVRVSSPTLKYYPIEKPIKRFIWSEKSVINRMAFHLMSVLSYRLRSLENSLEIFGNKKAGVLDKDLQFEKLLSSKQLKMHYQVEAKNRLDLAAGGSTALKKSQLHARSKFTELQPVISHEANYLKDTFKLSATIQEEIDNTTYDIKPHRYFEKKNRAAFRGKFAGTETSMSAIGSSNRLPLDSSAKGSSNGNSRIRLMVKVRDENLPLGFSEEFVAVSLQANQQIQGLKKALNAVSPRTHRSRPSPRAHPDSRLGCRPLHRRKRRAHQAQAQDIEALQEDRQHPEAQQRGEDQLAEGDPVPGRAEEDRLPRDPQHQTHQDPAAEKPRRLEAPAAGHDEPV